MAHWIAGLCRGLAGILVEAREHLEKTESFCVPEFHSHLAFLFGLDPGSVSKIHLAWLSAYLGYLDQSRVKSEEGITLARSLAHPHTLCFVIGVAAVSDWRRLDWEAMRLHSEESLEIAAEQGLPHTAGMALCLKGMAIAHQGAALEGVELIHSGIRLNAQIGTSLNKTMYLEILATAYALAGELREAHKTVDDALAAMEEVGELKHRVSLPILKGRIFANSGELVEAEEWLMRGIELARSSEAKLMELEAATSLARIWLHGGKAEEARDLLGPIYAWFTEGFEEVPLKEARALLEELS
jgi:predicted ATPase